MRVESDFFHDHKKESRNFELIAVSAIKSSVSLPTYPLLCRKSLFFNVQLASKKTGNEI
jgi:hypothetical protein